MSRDAIKLAAIFGGVILLAMVAALLVSNPAPRRTHPLPIPNGFDDFVRAESMVAADTFKFEKMDEANLHTLVAKNSNTVAVVRAGLQKDCCVPPEHLPALVSSRTGSLIRFRILAQALCAEGRLATLEHRPTDAARAYLETIQLGIESTRGGVLINTLIGSSVEHMGSDGLQSIVGDLDARTCRDAAAAIEREESRRQSWTETLELEQEWMRQRGGLRDRLTAFMARRNLLLARQQGEKHVHEQQEKTRMTLLALAARAYSLEKGKSPTSVNDLVPDYLKTIPKNPFTGTNLTLAP
jgi:hypothetical protein